MTSTPETDLFAEPGSEGKREAFNIALGKARRLCASREYCISEMRTRIGGWGVSSSSETDEIISRLLEERFIDEQRYANAFARDKLKYNKWGRIKIAYHLKMKDIPASLVAEATRGLDEDEYRKVATGLINQLLRQKKGGGSYQEKARIIRSMQAKGFETGLSMELLGDQR